MYVVVKIVVNVYLRLSDYRWSMKCSIIFLHHPSAIWWKPINIIVLFSPCPIHSAQFWAARRDRKFKKKSTHTHIEQKGKQSFRIKPTNRREQSPPITVLSCAVKRNVRQQQRSVPRGWWCEFGYAWFVCLFIFGQNFERSDVADRHLGWSVCGFTAFRRLPYHPNRCGGSVVSGKEESCRRRCDRRAHRFQLRRCDSFPKNLFINWSNGTGVNVRRLFRNIAATKHHRSWEIPCWLRKRVNQTCRRWLNMWKNWGRTAEPSRARKIVYPSSTCLVRCIVQVCACVNRLQNLLLL